MSSLPQRQIIATDSLPEIGKDRGKLRAHPDIASQRGLQACRELARIGLEREREPKGIKTKIEEVLQRAVEIVIAVLALIVATPVMLVLAVIVMIDTPGAPIFRQVRVGKNGRLFKFCKFRTLYSDARQRFPELYSYDYTPAEIENHTVKREDDPRVTRFGRFLRKTTLDELPNFWNLLWGHVALVGPRPDIPEYVPHYRPDQLLKFSVKPGITGLAQVSGRNRITFQQTIAYDLQYIAQRSFWMDVKIVFRTALLVFQSRKSGAL